MDQEAAPVKKIKKSGDKDKHKKKVRKTNLTRRPKRSTYSEHVRDHYSSWENTTTLISSGMWRLFLDNRRYDASGNFPNQPQQAPTKPEDNDNDLGDHHE